MPMISIASRAAVVAVVRQLGDQRPRERAAGVQARARPDPGRMAPSRSASRTSAVPEV